MTGSGRRTGPEGSGDALLSVEGLTVGFRTAKGYADILHAVSFAVRPGTTTCIVGESGSGKSVSCQAVLGLLPGNGRRTAGRILFEGRDLAAASEAESEGPGEGGG